MISEENAFFMKRVHIFNERILPTSSNLDSRKPMQQFKNKNKKTHTRKTPANQQPTKVPATRLVPFKGSAGASSRTAQRPTNHRTSHASPRPLPVI